MEERGERELFAPKVKTRNRAPPLQFWLEGNAWSHGSTSAGFRLSSTEMLPVTRINRILANFRETVLTVIDIEA